jgi:hypothetical protein
LAPAAGGSGRHLADEAALVQLADQLLERGIEGLADLLRHFGERGAAVDGGEHRAIGSGKVAGLAGGFLDPLPRLRVDRASVHCLLLFYSAITAAAGRLDHEHVARRHLGLIERSELVDAAAGAQH